jgi:hypothetical protein
LSPLLQGTFFLNNCILNYNNAIISTGFFLRRTQSLDLGSTEEIYTSLKPLQPPLIKIFAKKENAEKKKKMWKGDFVCVGTVLGFTNY